MVDVDKLQRNEVNELMNHDNNSNVDGEVDELSRLQSLILDGAKARIPIIIDYPKEDGTTEELALKIRPITDVEFSNAMRLFRDTGTSFRIECLKKALYTKDDKQLPASLVQAMHSGVIAALYDKLSEISGIKANREDQQALVDEMLGF